MRVSRAKSAASPVLPTHRELGEALDGLVAWTAAMVGVAFAPWPAEVRCLDLVEETGELCRALLVAQGRKPPPGEELATAVCGVLMDLLALAHTLGLKLGSAYPEEVERLVQRARRQP